MKILLLHNNDVPFSFISENWGDDIDLEIEIITINKKIKYLYKILLL